MRYSVSLCLSVEADTEEKAAKEFRKQVIEDCFGGDSMEIECEIDDTCEQCKKLGETTCGNDIQCRCFEPIVAD